MDWFQSVRRIVGSGVIGAAIAACGCSTEPKTEADKSTLSAECAAAMQRFRNEDPTLQALLDKSVGWAVFPEVGKAGLIAGGSYGRGEVYEKGVKIGYCDISQATIGLQIGAQTFSELVVFLHADELEKFKTNQLEFAANLSAVALTAGAAGTADHSKGVIVFTLAKGGLMAEASVGGQQFTFKGL